MTTQHATRADGTVLFHFTAGALTFEVVSTPAELTQCCNFLAAAANAGGTIRLGLFGAYEVQLTSGTDDWSVRVHVSAAVSDGSDPAGQSISADIRKLVLLRALTQVLQPQPVSAGTGPAPIPETTATPASTALPAHATAHTDRRIVHTAADMRRLVVHVATHWTVPHIDVALEKFTELDRQRAQTRIARLAGVSEYQSLGGWAAVITVIIGTTWIVQSFTQRSIEQRFIDTYVTSAGLWKYALWLAIAAGCAWLAGKWLGALWCRLRVLLALCRLWLRARALEGTPGNAGERLKINR